MVSLWLVRRAACPYGTGVSVLAMEDVCKRIDSGELGFDSLSSVDVPACSKMSTMSIIIKGGKDGSTTWASNDDSGVVLPGNQSKMTGWHFVDIFAVPISQRCLVGTAKISTRARVPARKYILVEDAWYARRSCDKRIWRWMHWYFSIFLMTSWRWNAF